MNIVHLKSFVTLANVLNYTKAADALYITQSALTRHIKNMETELECKLFERNTHQVSLTPEGENFLLYATKIVLTYRNATRSLKDFSQNIRQTLNVGYHRGGSQHSLAQMFRDFLKQHQGAGIDIVFHDGNHDDLLSSLKSGHHDLCFSMATTLAGEREISLIPLETLQTVLIVRYDHPLANRKRVSFDDFRKEPYVCVEKRITKSWYDFIVNYYVSHGSSPRFAGECSSVTTLLLMVEIGNGITILTDGCKHIMPDTLRAIPIDEIASPKSIAGYMETNANPALAVFVQWLKANREKYS